MISLISNYKVHILLFLYLISLSIVMLMPFDFDFSIIKNNAKWLETRNGIQFHQKGKIISKNNTHGLYQMLTKGDGLTIELWVKPYKTFQHGPARIISYSIDPYLRNFTLAQSKDELVIRLRTETTDPNGINPHVEVSSIFEANKIYHIMVTYNFVRECIFINGKMRVCEGILEGNFSNWDSSFKLVIGNEASGNRPWLGEIYYAAIYDKALSSKEIQKKYETGLYEIEDLNECTDISDSIPAVCYLFNEKNGNTVIDTGRSSYKINLHIPYNLYAIDAILNTWSLKYIQNEIYKRKVDIAYHLFAFIPLGFLLHRLIKFRFRTIFIILILGLPISLGFEILQFFTSRESSIIEALANVFGLSFGIVIDKYIR